MLQEPEFNLLLKLCVNHQPSGVAPVQQAGMGGDFLYFKLPLGALLLWILFSGINQTHSWR